jgi:tetratricopeptide (TPR) repeat protein
MSHSEAFEKLFTEFKSCSLTEAGDCGEAIIETFLGIDREEQKAMADTVYSWARQNAQTHPAQLRYARMIHAFSLFYTEQYDEAIPELNALEHVFDDQQDADGVAVIQNFLGSIYRTFGNVDLALKYCWSAHDQLLKSGKFPFFFLANNINLAGIYLDRKHYEEAIPHYQRALELAEKLGKHYMAIYAMQGLGKIYLMQKQYPAAKDWFDKAMVVAKEFGVPLSVSNALTEIGNYYFTLQEYPEAENYHQQALEIREQNHLIGAAVTNCIWLGEIYIQLSRPDDAVAILQKGLTLATQIHVKPKMYQIEKLLSEIYEKKKDLVKSLAHFKSFHELREQVELEDNERKIKNAQLVFEAEQTRKENIIIKQQKKEIEKKNIELQETIDELTRAKIGKKARAITLGIAIALFMVEETILHFAMEIVSTDNFFISVFVKMIIIFSISPINKAVEHYLYRRLVKNTGKKEVLV